jgi:hypothetical protein
MKKLTRERLFAGPKKARKARTRLARANLVIVAARERAAEVAQQSAARPVTLRPTGVAEAPSGREVESEVHQVPSGFGP